MKLQDHLRGLKKARAFKKMGQLTVGLSVLFTGFSNCDSASEYETSNQLENTKQLFPDSETNNSNPIYLNMKKKFYESCKDETDFLIGVSQLKQLLNSSASDQIVLLDQREPEEQAIGKIPSAILYQNFNLQDAVKDKKYIIYCTIGCRSGSLTEELRNKGLEAYNLVGGVLAWSWLQESFVDEKGNSTKAVHVYSEDWNFLNPSYRAIFD